MEKVDVECWVTNTKLLARLLGENEATFKPVMVVVPTEDKTLLDNQEYKQAFITESQRAMQTDDQLHIGVNYCKTKFPVTETDGGSNFSKVYGVDPDSAKQLLLINPSNFRTITCPWQFVWNGSPAEMSNKDKTIKLTINSYERGDTLVVHCDTKKVQQRMPSLYDDYYGSNYSSAYDWEEDPNDPVKVYKSKRARIFDEKQYFELMVRDLKDITLETLSKAVQDAAEEFNKCNYFKVAEEFPFAIGSGRKTHTVALKGKDRIKTWRNIIERFIAFLHFLFQENRDLIQERRYYEQGDDFEGGERSESSRIFHFKPSEIEKIRFNHNAKRLLSFSDELVEMLCSGFDLSKSPKIVEENEDRGGGGFFGLMSFNRERKGEILKKQIAEFTQTYLEKPDHILMWFNRVAKSILDKDAQKYANIYRTCIYFYDEYIKKYGTEIRKAIVRNDKERENYFKVIVNVVDVISKSEFRKDDYNSINWFVTGSALKDVPNLPNEFYKLLFQKTKELTKKVYLEYFSSTLISKQDKSEMMFSLIAESAGVISLSLSEMVEEFILNPNTIPGLSMEDLFTLFKARYPISPNLIDDFIRNRKNCNLHRSVLRAINLIVRKLPAEDSKRKFLSTQEDSYFMTLHKEIVKYMASCLQDISIRYINSTEYINLGLVGYLEDFKPTSFGAQKFADIIVDYERRLKTIKSNLAFYISVFEKNEHYMVEYDFKEPFMKLLKDFRSDIDNYTIVQIEKNQNYIDCNCLKDPVWDAYHICQEYQIYFDELKARCTKDIKLVDYKKQIDTYCADLKKRFLGFLEDKKYTLKDYHYHFRRIMWAERIETYEAAVKALGLSDKERLVLFNHSRAFHALHKILKLKEPIETIVGFKFLSLSFSPFIASIQKLFKIFHGKDFGQITYEELKQADKGINVLVTEDYSKCKVYQLPIVIRNIAASPDVLNFMKEKGTDFIKSMRDECDNENLDIINKLDVINKNLNFIVQEKSIDVVLEKLTALPKVEQRKIKQYLNSIEGLITSHIIHLADKTKKDTGYNRKIINHILDKSTLTLNYSMDQKDYTTVVKYFIASNPFTVDAIELGELFNKAKIIVNENQNKEEMLDEYQQCMSDFNMLGKELQDLTNSLKVLRALGLIDNKFHDLIDYLNSHTKQKCFNTNLLEDKKAKAFATELIINFGKESNGTEVLHKVNSELRNLTEKLTGELYSYYSQECYLFTYFYGKKLYYLIEYLRGRLGEIESEEVLNLVKEAFPPDELRNFNNNYHISPNPSEVFKDVFDVLKDWSKQISAKQKIKLNSSRVFQLKKIVVVVNPVMNKYKTMIKIMAEAGENIFSLSQVLFCRKETTRNEIYAFVNRSLLDPFKRIYFIMNIHVLEYYLLLELRNFINKTIENESENVNYNLLIFADKTEYHKDLLENVNFCKDLQLDSLETFVTDEDIRNRYSHVFTANQLVMSPVAGMGKTTFITEKSKKFDLIELFLAGELNKNTITKRLNNLSKQAQDKTKLAINIKLDFIEDFSVFSELVDYTLFCVSLVNRYYTDRGCKDLRGNLKLIFFEIGNTFSTELLLDLDTLKIFNVDPKPEEASRGSSMHKYKITTRNFSLDFVNYSEELQSDQQVVANFYKLFDSGDFVLSQCSEENRKLISEEEFRAMLKKHFMAGKSAEEKSKITYAQYSFWLKTLATMVREMEKVTDLAPKKLEADNIPVETRAEIASEINIFCSQIINLSVNQAKTSQDEMKKILNSLTKERIKANKMDEYKNKFVRLEPWDSSDMVVPLFNQAKVLISHTNLDLFNKPGSQRFRNRLNLKRFIREKKTFVDPDKTSNPSEEYLKRLADLLGSDFDDLKSRSRQFMGGKGFSITRENFMKMCLIILKAELKTPIIMMGESGCGKTYVSQYTSKVLLQEELHELTLYSGVTEADFVNFMKKAIASANEAAKIGKRVWVFFDEFNTSCLQSIVAEIMLDRRCPIDLDIYKIPDNIVFISCCNPYRMKTKKADVGLVPKTTDNLLSHRVYPIPERLINFIWDFGQLSDKDEYNHLRSIIEANKIFDKSNINGMLNFCNLIYTAHKFVRDIEERSGVSLRDIKRVISIYNWFKGTLEFYEKEVLHKKRENTVINHLNAAIAATMVCYGLRLNGRAEQVEFIQKLVTSANQARSMGYYMTEEIKSILSTIAQNHFDQLQDLKAGIIPDGIAMNTPLKENFIAMLACFDTMTPLIICGAPGTSKTLCTQIFNSALTPNVIKNCTIFSRYRGINAMYYGGSQTSTSEGISKVFQRGEKYLENKGEDRPVVVFDEIGLAELSPHNPLKILHPLLEKVNMEVGFLGLSNWTLDLSKMNRLIYLARPDMTQDDLFEIFKISIAKCTNPTIQSDLERFLKYLTIAYLKFRQWQKKHGSHPNFHGSRDIYGVSKFIYRELQKIKHYDTSLKARDLIKLAIERNFNGAIYLFGEQAPGIPAETVPNLHEGFAKKTLLNMIRIKEFGNPYDKEADKLDDLHMAAQTEDEVVIYGGTEVFKKLFLNEVIQHKDAAAQLFQSDFLAEHKVLDMVNMNINDKTARFLLIKSEGEVIDNIFLEKLREFNKSDKIIDWRGVRGKENSIELLSTLKSYISLGYVVVMKNLDELYGSLYDLFNQKYMEVDGRQYCYLYYGENKHRVEVHPDFKAIVILPSEKELEGLDVELEQPAPFLNRFEKFFLRISNILSYRKIQELIVIRNHLKKTVLGYSSRVLALSIDMLASLCVSKKDMSSEAVEAAPGANEQLPVVTEQHKQGIMKLTTLNYLLYEDLTDEDIKQFLLEHPYANLDAVLKDLNRRVAAKVCLMTFSNPMEIEPLRETIQRDHGLKIHSSEEIYTLGLEKRSQLIKNYKETTFAIQFIYTEHLSMISQIKSNIEQNSKITKVLFIIHLERDPRKREILSTNIGVNYWNEWDNRVLDNIQHTYYQEYVDIKNLTFEELFLSTTYSTGINLFKEAIVMCIIKITHDEKDLSLRINMFNIRKMIQNDEHNTFIDAFREKIKSTKIFTKDPTSWIKIIRDRNSLRDFYVDLDVELLNYFKDKYCDEVKKYIQKLNYDLANIASYSLGYQSSLPDVVALFKQNLKKGIEDCIMSTMEIQKHTMMMKRNIKDKSITFFRLPFLSQIYKKLQQGISEHLQRDNSAEFGRLSNFTAKLKVAVLYKVAEEQAEVLRTKIANAEKFLHEAISKLIAPIIEQFQEKLPGLMDSPEIKNALALDILSIASSNIEVIQQQEILEIFRIICYMLNRNSTESLVELFSTACIMSISLKSQTVFLLEIMNISNFSAQEIDIFRQGLSRHQEQYKLDYGSIDKFVNFCQEKLIPEFDDPKLKLRLYRDKYEKLIDRLMSDNPNIAENDTNIYNFRSLINLFGLLDILPPQKRLNYLSKLKNIKNDSQRFGSGTHLEFVRKQILTIFFESGDIKDIKTSEYCLILSEHIAINAVMCNFELFLEDRFDLLFSKFSKPETEKISATLGSTLAQRIPDFYSLANLKKALDLIKTDSVLINYNEMLTKINLDKNRNLYFVVSFLDCLYIKGISNPERAYDTEFVEILEFVLQNADFSVEYKSLKNLIFYSVLRVIFNPKVMKELLITNPEWISKVDSLFIENSRSKEYFCNNPNSNIFIYWLQSIIREYGDLGTYQPLFPAINNVCTLILEEDVQGTITFFEPAIRANFVSLRDELDDASYKKDVTRMREIFSRTHEGDRRIQHYMIGVALINKFVNQVKQTDAAVVQNLKNSYTYMFGQMNENPLYMELLKIIVDDHTMGYSHFMSNETDPQFNIRLRKTFLQFMLVSILFESFGYNYNGWKEWKDEIDYSTFKCKLANTEKINNYCSVGENIIIERLADGSYQDYGHNLGKNLGIYRCSCGHIYSIGNCGYAMMKSKCPKCGLDIGGEGHNLLQREGHIHIKTLQELFGMIKDEYFKASGYYNMHTVVNHTSLEFFPLKIIEIGAEKFLEKRKMKANTPFWQVFFCNLFIRHLFDHMFLTILPETLTTTKEAFNTKVKGIINYDTPLVKELYGKMSGKEIHNHMEYFLAHVKNDIDVLAKELLFENPVDIFDWIRAMLTVLVEKMTKGTEFRQSETPILTETDVTQPKQLIIQQEKNIEAMVSTDISTKFVVKSMFFRKVDGDLLRTFMREYKDESHFIYQFFRHNKFERNKLFAEFNKQLEVSDCTLLKLIVKYNHVLKEFPRMVKANLDLAYYLMNNYSRLYNFDEASSVDILCLPDPRIKELFKEFEYVWEHIIPKHEDTNPEIFSFAYLCQQNLNVDGFIKRIRSPGGAMLVNLVFVDSKTYASQDLLYMKAILETFIKKFHNMFVDHINKIMQIELGDADRTLAEFCDEGSFMSSHNYEPVVESNFWYNTEVSGENELYFDLKRIEYLCAKAMKKKWINFEEADLVYYMFKDANIKENAKTIEDMLLKIEKIEVDASEKQVIDQMSEVQVTKSHEFLMEIGDYVYQNFLFHDPERTLKSIIENIDSQILRKRFNSYDEKLHCRLKVGHLPEYYDFIQEKKFNYTFSMDRHMYNKPLSSEDKVMFKDLINDPNVEGSDLEEIKIQIKDMIREYYEQGTPFTMMKIKDLVFTLADIAPGAEFIGELTFSQFLEISTILNDGIMVKNKNNFVRRTSSNIYGHAEKRRSSNMRED